MFQLAAVTSFVAGSAAAADVVVGLPPSHPGHSIIAKFAPNFRCPHAAEWVKKGPEQAAIDMGLLIENALASSPATGSNKGDATSTTEAGLRLRHRRMQQQGGLGVPENVVGSCTFTSQWTGPSCVEFRGEPSVWTQEAMQGRCNAEPESTLLATSAGCTSPEGGMGGWCITFNAGVGGVEAAAMIVSPQSDCAQLETACVSFAGGMFMADEACGATSVAPAAAAGSGGNATATTGSGGNATTAGSDSNPPSTGGGPPEGITGGNPAFGGSGAGEPPKCMIAPGTRLPIRSSQSFRVRIPNKHHLIPLIFLCRYSCTSSVSRLQAQLELVINQDSLLDTTFRVKEHLLKVHLTNGRSNGGPTSRRKR